MPEPPPRQAPPREGSAPDFETMVSSALDANSLGDRSSWLQAEIAANAWRTWRVRPGTWGASIGRSASWVRSAIRTVEAFPSEEQRCPLLPFAVHVACAATDDPAGWLRQAEAKEWSAADLRRAIRESGQQATHNESALAEGEHLLYRLRRWAEEAPPDIRAEILRRVRQLVAEVR